MHRIRFLIVVLSCLLIWPATFAAAQEKTLRIGINTSDVGSLDPHRAQTTSDRALASWMFNALVRFPPGSMDLSKIEPDLAERWEASPGGLVWTFHLRQGVKFHG